MPKNNHLQSGYIALMSILILGAVGALIAVSLLMISVGSAQISIAVKNSYQARYMADTCAEMALMAIHSNPSTTEQKELVFPEGICNYSIIGENSKIIEATGKTENNVRKVKIITAPINTESPKIQVLSWKEVADF